MAQAERDFKYVLDRVPDHVFACLGLAEVMKRRNQSQLSKKYIERAKAIVAEGDPKWSMYLDELNVDINKVLGELQ